MIERGSRARRWLTTAYDEALADRMRDHLGTSGDVVERKMFGGLTFMVNGHMCCGVSDDRIMVRLDPEEAERALEEPGASRFDATGRPLKGMLWVSPDTIQDDQTLEHWVQRAATHARSKPPK